MTAYLPTVTKTITLPGGVRPNQAECRLRLIASATLTDEATGYVTRGGVDVVGIHKVTFNSSGVATFLSVNPNADSGSTTVITAPTGTVYEVTTLIKNRPTLTEYISVPDAAGPYAVQNILTSAPDNIPSAVDIALITTEAAARAAGDATTLGNAIGLTIALGG